MKLINLVTKKPLIKDIKREENGWSVWAWWPNDLAPYPKRYIYQYRDQARRADITDRVGENGRIA